ncbi:DUF4249 domain-containing protein [Mucilaginibacter corticis]|nr:DUF4249 domain-containing protein [Mucilaginibacter corticis]
MKNRYKLTVIILLCMVIGSCKKVIDLNLKNADPQLVIEGNITDESKPQFVSITKSVAIDNSNNFPAVTGALVNLIDQSGTFYRLTERTPGNYYSSILLGKHKQQYTLQVQYNTKTYTAVSTMPDKVSIDSVALSLQYFGQQVTKTIIVFYQDPLAETNQYYFVLTINGVQVKQVFAKNDYLNNGRAVQQLLYEDDIKLKSGDQVHIEMQCIDPIIYNYWYTLSLQQTNDFSSTTPSNPVTNFNDKSVLGYFSAHTTDYKDIIIP